jgi:hypothetical protein
MSIRFVARVSPPARSTTVIATNGIQKRSISMSSDEARARAENSFKKEQQAREGAKAWLEYEATARATQEKTARLRALRLAKEAADTAAAEAAAPAAKTTRRRVKVD